MMDTESIRAYGTAAFRIEQIPVPLLLESRGFRSRLGNRAQTRGPNRRESRCQPSNSFLDPRQKTA